VGLKTVSFALLCGASAVPAAAQPAPAPVPPPPAAAPVPVPAALAPEPRSGTDIIVTGQRPRGSVVGNVQPEETLNQDQVRAYGASSVGELIEALAPQTRSGRGRSGGGDPPVVLLNGRRIAGFQEIRNLPPEAIERVDILPEEVALSYGYRADQRVVNIVLKENFRAVTVAGGIGLPTAGGQSNVDANASIVRIGHAGRWNVEAQYQHSSALLESERDLVQSTPALPFDLTGNVGAFPYAPGAEVDPALSAAAGTPVTVAAVPGSAATGAPTLGDFVAGANRPNVTDLGRYRSLIPASDSLTLNGTLSRTLFGNVAATVNLRFGTTSSESRFGLPSLALALPAANPFSPFSQDVSLFRYADALGPLRSESDGRTGHGGLTLDGAISRAWRFTVTANYDRARAVTRTDTNADPTALQARLAAGDPTLNPFAPIGADLLVLRPEDRAESNSESADAQAVFNGPLLRLPAGQVTASFTVAANTLGQNSETMRAGVTQIVDLSRDRGAAQGSLDVPVLSRRDGFTKLGEVSLNLNLNVEHLSDFGTLRTIGYGVRWSPVELVDLAVNATDEDGAPSIQQLGDPVIVTPNARVFDFTRGETVDVTRTSGGNPALIADNRHVFSVRGTIRPLGPGGPGRPSLSIVVNYTNTRIENPISSFPVATAEIEAAFPGRFQRGPDGRLLAIDARPVNFARSDREELRWGFTFQKQFRPPAGAAGAGGPGGPGARPPGGPRSGGRPPGAGPRGPGGPGGGGRRGGGGGAGGFGGGPGSGGFNISIFHTWRFTDDVLIRPGVPDLDYLDGSAFSGRGGRPRHELELQAGIFRNGVGGFLRAQWQSGTLVRGGATSDDLRFSDYATVNLFLFADLGQQQRLVRHHGWLRGTQVQLGITNIFDSRQRVRDETGATPLSYQPDYLDPLGRSVRIGLRKLFF
jgi:iron complex outermembrane receptor protein